jgi:hypothetical protein
MQPQQRRRCYRRRQKFSQIAMERIGNIVPTGDNEQRAGNQLPRGKLRRQDSHMRRLRDLGLLTVTTARAARILVALLSPRTFAMMHA